MRALPILRSSELAARLRQLNLLRPGQQDEVERQLVPFFDDARYVARELARRGWITAYQQEKLLDGQDQELVLGLYVLLEPLGSGGMGHVFKARHLLMNRVVALKVIRRDRLAKHEAISRFQREIQASAQLAHPNIVMALDAAKVGDLYFLVMEYVEGPTLERLVREHGPLPVRRACEYIRQTALALQHAHERGMVHRDIKPANLLLSLANDGTAGTIKLSDLGLSRFKSEASQDRDPTELVTGEGVTMGTPDYMAPEQARDARSADIRADIYSLGCTFYHLLTGSAPFGHVPVVDKLLLHRTADPPPLEVRRPGLPPGLAAIVHKMLSKQPAQRQQTPAEVAAALEPYCQGSAAEEPPYPPPPGSQAPKRDSPSAIFASLNETATQAERPPAPPTAPTIRGPESSTAPNEPEDGGWPWWFPWAAAAILLVGIAVGWLWLNGHW
jgi:serine/threonine protein kinase